MSSAPAYETVSFEHRVSVSDLLLTAYEARLQQGLTRYDVAIAMGEPFAVVEGIESGVLAPTLGQLLRYGWAIGLNLSWNPLATTASPTDDGASV